MLLSQAKKGGFKDCLPEDLLTAVLKATLDRSKIDPSLIEDIAVGNVLPPGGGANVARAAQLKAGIPHTYVEALVLFREDGKLIGLGLKTNLGLL